MKDEELEKDIERVKKLIEQYQALKPLLKPSQEDYEIQLNIFLDRLAKLIKKREENEK